MLQIKISHELISLNIIGKKEGTKRKLEVFFAILIATMSFSFGYNYFAHIPPQGPLFEGMAFPWTANFADSAVLLQVQYTCS